MKSVKGFLIVATSLAVLFACESDRAVDPSPDGEGPVDARSPHSVQTPGINAVGTTETRIDVNWGDVLNETGYELYRAVTQTGAYELLVKTEASVWSYTDTQVSVPTEYCYKVRAFRKLGSQTVYSEFSSSPCILTPPNAPSNLTATVSSYKIAVAWQDNSSIESAFRIFVSQSPSGPFALRTTTDANVTSWLEDVGAGVTSCYRVQAFRTITNSLGTGYIYSTESNTACATTPPPSQPPTAIYQVFPSPATSSEVVIRLQQVVPETQPYSSGYRTRLERSVDGSTVWSIVQPSYYSDYYDYPLAAEVRVCYRFIVSNEAGDGQPSNVACTVPPAAPTNLAMFPIDAEHVELTWTDNSAVEDGYQVWLTYGYGNCSCGASACDAGWTEDSYAVATLPANTTRYVAPPLFGDLCRPSTSSYYIVALKDGGTSDWSNAVMWQPATSP